MKKQRGEKSCLSSATLYHVAVSDQLNNMLTRIFLKSGVGVSIGSDGVSTGSEFSLSPWERVRVRVPTSRDSDRVNPRSQAVRLPPYTTRKLFRVPTRFRTKL